MSRLKQIQIHSCPHTGQISMRRTVGQSVVEEEDVTMAVMAAAIESLITKGPEPLTLYGKRMGQDIKFTLSVTQEVVSES